MGSRKRRQFLRRKSFQHDQEHSREPPTGQVSEAELRHGRIEHLPKWYSALDFLDQKDRAFSRSLYGAQDA